jgi:hypothetical protein
MLFFLREQKQKEKKMGKKIDHYIFLTSSEAAKYTPKAIKEGVLSKLSDEKCELGWRCPSAVYEDGTKSKLDNATCWHHKSYKMGVSKDGEYLWRETLQSRDNMLALCDHCHAKLHTESERNPGKYSDICPSSREYVKSKLLVFFKESDPPRDDLLSLREVERIFGVGRSSARKFSDTLKRNGLNIYKLSPKGRQSIKRCKTFYSKSDLLKCGLKEKKIAHRAAPTTRDPVLESALLVMREKLLVCERDLVAARELLARETEQKETAHEMLENQIKQNDKLGERISKVLGSQRNALETLFLQNATIESLKRSAITQDRHIAFLEDSIKAREDIIEVLDNRIKKRSSIGIIKKTYKSLKSFDLNVLRDELPLPGQAGA